MYSVEEYFLLIGNAFKQREKKLDPAWKMEVSMTYRVAFYSLVEHRILNISDDFIFIFKKNAHTTNPPAIMKVPNKDSSEKPLNQSFYEKNVIMKVK